MQDPDVKKAVIELKIFITTIILLGILIISTGIASYIIPAGTFNEAVKDGKTVKVYQEIVSTPVPVWKIVLSPFLSVTGKNGPKIIVLSLFILLIGGSFSIMNKSGVLPAILGRLVDRFSDRKRLFLLINILLFSILGSALGIIEEIVPMILFFVPIAYRMKWDSLTGIAIPFVSAGFGFSAATFNPFTLGTAQSLSGLPLFSGLPLRAVLFLCTTTVVMLYMTWYTKRIEKNPEKSITYEIDLKMKELNNFETTNHENVKIKGPLFWMLFSFTLIIGVVAGGNFVKILQTLAFPLIALIFMIMGFGTGLLSGSKARDVLRFFIHGLIDFAPAILLVLMAAAVGYLIEIGNIMDTILFYISQLIQDMSKGGAALLLYASQMLMNFLVPSGTGQAVLTIPILAPLGDLVGLTRQTVVLAFQCGDGFSNLIWPTNPMLIIAIGLAGVNYKQWLKWIIPLQLALMGICTLFLLYAVHIDYM